VTASRVVLWRHGQTEYNRRGIWQGHLDIPLDEDGHAQAKAGAAALAEWLPEDEPVTMVCSDLQRARTTAEYLAVMIGRPVTTDARLREINAGRWEGKDRQRIVTEGMGADFDAWRRGEDVSVGGGERRSEASRRCVTAIVEHADAVTEGILVVVGHGGVLRGSILALLGLPLGQWGTLGTMGNAHWSVLRPGAAGIGTGPADGVPSRVAPPGGWSLLAYNLSAGR
jgi:glucosyl-3-phosphoglycerate phosphatase